MEPDPRQVDYEHAVDLVQTITDVRFKLLALVPTLSGAAVTVLGHPSSAAELIAVGLLGLTATVGVLLYELRNAQLYNYGLRRAQALEHELGLALFTDRPGRALRLFGTLPVDRDSGLALVYSAAIAGWMYLCAWGVLHAANVGQSRAAGGAIAVAVGLALLVELTRLRETP